MFIHKEYTPGLSINSYLIGDLKARVCAVIDPTRNIHRYIEVAKANQLSIVAILETHVHADFVSGSKQLKHTLQGNPKIYCSQMGGAERIPKYTDCAVKDKQEIVMGSLCLKAIHTPGHTPEHLSWAVYDNSRSTTDPCLIFTGDFLFVGSVGRPDLFDQTHFETLSKELYHSIFQVLKDFPDYVEVYPSHGAGSFCGKSIQSNHSSTLGYEKKYNPSLQMVPENEWIANLMKDMPPIPPYFQNIRSMNLEGPPLIEKGENSKNLSAQEVNDFRHKHCQILDTRSKEAFSTLHIPNAINIPFSDTTLITWAGWALNDDDPIILVTEEEGQLAPLIRQLQLVGLDKIVGYLQGGIASWESEGFEIARVETLSIQDLAKDLREKKTWTLIDVRSDQEWDSGHIEEALHIPFSKIVDRSGPTDPAGHYALMCRSGYRASIAASLLKKQGFNQIANVLGGMEAWEKEQLKTIRTEQQP